MGEQLIVQEGRWRQRSSGAVRVGGVVRAASAASAVRAALLASALVLASCQHAAQPGPGAASAGSSRCDTVSDIPGTYTCSGECVVTGAEGRKLQPVSGETDVIERFPGAQAELYQVHITAPGFTELEIGALVGTTLRTSTAEVIDNHFPVLEEYVFQADSACKASGFAKNVRNPSQAQFKSCLVQCRKQ